VGVPLSSEPPFLANVKGFHVKRIVLVVLLLCSTVASAMDQEEKQCIRQAFGEWSEAFVHYWDEVGREMKRTNPDVYSEFHFLIQEQKNHNRLSQITLEYLLDNHPEDLRLTAKIYGVVPLYLNYHQKKLEDLRKISEFDRLFLKNQSYLENEKNTSQDRLKAARQVIEDIRNMPRIKSIANEVLKKGDVLVSELKCES
jgi:hypothetical protein